MDESTRALLAAGEAAEHRRRAEALLTEAGARLAHAALLAADERRHGFSIVRAVRVMSERGNLNGFEAEVCQEHARRSGRTFDAVAPVFPWTALLGRTLQVSTSGGASLVGTSVPTIVEALRPWSVVMNAGVTLFDGLRDTLKLPRESAVPSAQWLTSETTSGTASDPQFASVTLTPKNAIAYTTVTRQLLMQSPAAEAFIATTLRRTAAVLVDQAVLVGTGAGGQPQGIVGAAGVTVTTGTNLSFADVLAEQEAIAIANVRDEQHVFVGHPTVRRLLSNRTTGTNAGVAPYIWQDDRVASRRAFATPTVGTGRIVHGDFSRVALATWGDGFMLETNPYDNFQGFQVGFRVTISCDVGLMQPTALRVIQAIT